MVFEMNISSQNRCKSVGLGHVINVCIWEYSMVPCPAFYLIIYPLSHGINMTLIFVIYFVVKKGVLAEVFKMYFNHKHIPST